MLDIIINFAPWIVGLLGVVGTLFYARKSGRDSERQSQYEERIEAIIEGKKIDQEVSSLSDDDLREHGRKWVRGSDKG